MCWPSLLWAEEEPDWEPCMADRSLHVLPLTCLTPPGLPMYCRHPITPPNRDPLDDLSTNRPQQAAICSTEQTNKNKTKQTLKPYDQRRISANHTPPSVSLPPSSSLLTSRMTVCSHKTQHGSTPRNCDFPDEPLPRAGPKARTMERSRSSSSQLLGAGEFPLGAVRLTRSPPSLERRIPGNWIEPT